MNIEKQRKAFEAWAYSNKWNIFRVRDIGLDHYVDDFVNGAWHGWLAAQQQEGYVLVPVEPTDKTIAHMTNTPIEVNLLCDHADVFLSEGEAYIAYKAMTQASQE